MARAGDESEELWAREDEVDDLWDEEQEERLAKVTEDANDCERHA